METKITPAWMKAIVLSLIGIILGLIVYFTGQAMNRSWSWIQGLIFIGGIIFFCIQFAKQMDGNVTFGNVFAHGFKITAGVAAITAVWTFIGLKFIYPEMVDLSLTEAEKGMREKNNMTEDQIQQALSFTKKFFMPFSIAMILIATAIMGCIASLIGAAVAKKNPNPNPL